MQEAEAKKDEMDLAAEEVIQEIKVKKGANLVLKLQGVVMFPMIVLVIFATLALRAVGNDTAERLVEKELNATEYAMQLNLDMVSPEDFRYENGMLYKGDVVLAEQKDFLANFKAETGVDVVLFWDNKLVVTSIDSADIVLETKSAEAAAAGETYFDTSADLGGTEYFAFSAPIYASGSTTPSGVLMTAVPVAENEAIYARIINSNVKFMIALVVGFCVISILILLLITKALLKIVGNLNNVAEGDLGVVIPEKLLTRSDEVGKIARSVRSVVVGFSRIVTNIYKSMDEMNEFAGQFSNNFDTIGQSIASVNIAVTEIAEGATRQASDTQRVSESMNDMNDALNKTADSVNALSNSADSMKKNNEKVDNTLKELLAISSRTQQSVDEVQKQTNLTNESVQAIQAATDIIAGIANQTNLLSLNASIEAARAGEMGRGFAVVADEIRGLADQSKESADRIRGIVETLIENSNHSVEIMNGVVGEIHQQNEKLDATINVFADLNDEVQSVVDAIGTISGELDNIEQYKNGVIDDIDGLNEISQNNAASTQETAATMDQLSQIVEDCVAATGKLTEISDELSNNAKKFRI